MEQIIEFREPIIKWSQYDEHDLHEIEERLFNISYTPSGDVQQIVNFRAKRDVKRSALLKFQKREYKIKKLSADVVALRDRVQRRTTFRAFSQHKDCFDATTGVQIPRDSDLSTNLSYEYLHRHPSPIFTSLTTPPKCMHGKNWPNLITIPFYGKLIDSLKNIQRELEDKTFSLVDFNFYYILRLRNFYKSISHMTDTALIKFIMLILLQLHDNHACFSHLVTILDRIQRSFDNNPVKMCPGIIICAPPGTGKTHFVDATGHFMLDTDFFNHADLDSNINIVRNLVNSGFSLVTNRWEYKEFSEWAVCILICLQEIRRFSNYGKQGIFEKFQELSDIRRKRLEQISFKYMRRRVCPIPIEDWETNLKRGLEVLPFIILKDDQSFSDGMVKVYQAITS